jgi:hypothetical protein
VYSFNQKDAAQVVQNNCHLYHDGLENKNTKINLSYKKKSKSKKTIGIVFLKIYVQILCVYLYCNLLSTVVYLMS